MGQGFQASFLYSSHPGREAEITPLETTLKE